MAQWTSTVGAAQLARQLRAQQPRPLPPGSRKPPAYRALADGVRLLVLEGRVPVAARLPAERELALALALSRTTVAAAYEALRTEGFLESRRGAGSWTAVPAGNPLPARGLEPLPPESLGSMIDLGCASLPAPEPWLTRAVRGALEELPPYAHTHGDYPAGLPALRQTIADRYTGSGVPTMPEQIMVTTGAMGAIDAICHLFAGRGERIAVESPSYANILQLMKEAGARLVPVAMEEGLGGWDMNRWRQVLRDAAPRLAYVVADFHNPTGALADERQRRALVEAARSAGTVLIADETMSELRLDAVDMPRRVCAFDPAGSTVLTVGSASKAFWAGMRIGWVRAAPDVIRSLVAARAYADMGTPVLEQLAVNWLMRTGGWEEAVALRRGQARENRDALVRAVRKELPEWEFEVPHGGLTLWVRTGGLSGSRLAVAGERVGVRVPSGPRFGVDGAFEGYVRLPFTVGGPVADEAAVRLAAAAELVGSGAAAGAEAPRTFVA
ncbi:PLP-dependent aminotransferase family protein [Streptomyces halstedii]|uniref:SCO1417 family MocR-like transcription factor n=3 Tax=Streptomyces TaxID=1883 RepID=UPI00048BC8DC|nr:MULTISPECIES: PLP-dependent aminotransferase family protein [Streptomyces]WSX39313.1 PLP-dependent aminotransferase family protein [Streptomyces halstedii]KDQ66028.1 GntR family transcriptional regulator [Streptomyces sp. NTK 937]MYR76686.1 aminotransferase class I/II-fold pyridoxal phosphate-dependent enzyme [Streptomyces sp. SID4925]MYY19529.1 aminotransferase class I/II-fold pyridoxal phosphate-dependent enzyme [Streptomyces sp. SID4912]SBU94034.1 DNA-binding transcriptional regulator, M